MMQEPVYWVHHQIVYEDAGYVELIAHYGDGAQNGDIDHADDDMDYEIYSNDVKPLARIRLTDTVSW